VAKLGVYDRVVSYDAIFTLPAASAVFVDIAGDGAVRSEVYHHLRDALKHSAGVGFTHWNAPGAAKADLPGSAAKLFFTPGHILRRRKEWGGETLASRASKAWRDFLASVKPWLMIEHAAGHAGVERVYLEVLGGRTLPQRAHILSIARP
jgi:Protein of unknown function (DUF2855)